MLKVKMFVSVTADGSIPVLPPYYGAIDCDIVIDTVEFYAGSYKVLERSFERSMGFQAEEMARRYPNFVEVRFEVE